MFFKTLLVVNTYNLNLRIFDFSMFCNFLNFVRLDRKAGNNTRLLYCTTGVLLRIMQADTTLSRVSHVFIDEVHERAADTDILLLFIRRLVQARQDLKVILMSATLDAAKFQHYFTSTLPGQPSEPWTVPVATVPGRTFPVKTFFLEDAVEQSQYVLEENSEYAKKSSYSWQHTKLNISQLGGKSKQEDITWGHEEYSGAWSDGEEVDENTSEIVANTIYSMDHHRINYDLVVELLQYICENACELTDPAEPQDAAILVFLPGMPEIQRLNKELTHSWRKGI